MHVACSNPYELSSNSDISITVENCHKINKSDTKSDVNMTAHFLSNTNAPDIAVMVRASTM